MIEKLKQKIMIFFALTSCFCIAGAHNYGYTTVILNSGSISSGTVSIAPTSNISRDSYALSCTTSGTGSVGATLILYAYNSPTDTPINVATLTTSGTTSDVVGIAGNVAWKYLKVNQTAISGTGANTICTLSY